MNKPTQQQIEAALAWADWNPLEDDKTRPTKKQIELIQNIKLNSIDSICTVRDILAAAYREKCDESAEPELLEALERLVRLPVDYNLLMDAEFVFSEARAVIKKAKGEMP